MVIVMVMVCGHTARSFDSNQTKHFHVIRQATSSAAPLSASVTDLKYLTELSQIQSRILQQQCVKASFAATCFSRRYRRYQLQGDLAYIISHSWETPIDGTPHAMS